MQSFEDIDLFDCPLCHGPGLIEEENGWCLYVQCLDCGCHTAALTYDNEEERQTAARQAVSLWNVGKVIHTGVGDRIGELTLRQANGTPLRNDRSGDFCRKNLRFFPNAFTNVGFSCKI